VRNNRHQPYPEHFQVKARTEATQHWGEKFNDLFLKDQVWAAREIWSTRVRAVEMTPFQEVSGPLWPKPNQRSKQVSLYGLSVPKTRQLTKNQG